MSNETQANTQTQTPAETPAQAAEATDQKSSGFSKAGSKLKKWQHGFVELKINRQLHILLSVILMIGLIFGGAIEKIIIILIAVPLLVSGITGVMFLETMLTKMPWNKAHKAAQEVQKETGDL